MEVHLIIELISLIPLTVVVTAPSSLPNSSTLDLLFPKYTLRNMIQFPFRLSSYFYHLDPTQIAQVPAVPPESARLMQLTSPYAISHGDFFQVPSLLDIGSLIFLNDTKVLPARIVQDFSITRNGKVWIKPCEILYLNMIEDSENTFEAMVYPGDNFPIGAIATVGEYQLEVLNITYQGRTFRMLSHNSIMDMLLEYGSFPIPPYINSSQVAQDSYQTEFAKQPGSLAAPTASLHFTKQLLESCVIQANAKIQYATLHVGIGTFKIINQEDIRDHTMHGELLIVTQEIFKNIAQAKLEKRPVIAIGTTMVRYLESLLYIWPLVAEQIDLENEIRAWWQYQSDVMMAANADSYAPPSKFRLRK